MRQPWEHVIALGLGGWAGNELVKFEHNTALELEELLVIRAERNKKLKDFDK